MWGRRFIIAVLFFIMLVPVLAVQNVGFGLTVSGDFNGIVFLLPSKTKLNPQIITSGYITDNYYNLLAGTKLLWELSEKDNVERYTGVGAGTSVFSVYNLEDDYFQKNNSYFGQAFLGTKVSWLNRYLAAPIKFCTEIGLSVNVTQERTTARTYIGGGIEYEF